MPVTKYEIHNKGTMREQTPLSSQLIRGEFVLLMVGMFLMASLAVAAPSPLRITIGTFAPYYSPTLVHIGNWHGYPNLLGQPNRRSPFHHPRWL